MHSPVLNHTVVGGYIAHLGPTHEWHVDIELTPFAIKLDNLDHRPGFQVCPG
jgi:hypothetical protein